MFNLCTSGLRLLLLLAMMSLTGPRLAQADGQGQVTRYNLRQLVSMAKKTYPGVTAAQHAVQAMERDLFRARWAWIPQGNVKGIVAPAPSVECYWFDEQGNKVRDPERCLQTTALTINSFDIAGILLRIEFEVGMPIYTFGKLSAAKRAASAGVDIKRAQLKVVENQLEHDVTRAYWGLKLAREILYTINEGSQYLEDAITKIEKDLDQDIGEFTITDLLRLKTSLAEIGVRRGETQKLEALTKAALAIFIGKASSAFDTDTTVIEALDGEPLPLEKYLEISQGKRPEIQLLKAAVTARHAAVDLEKARFLPDFLLVATMSASYTSSVDRPQNAFYNNPFNGYGAGFGLAMSWKFDQLQRYGLYKKAQAQAKETAAKKEEALRGINLEIFKALAELKEAQNRRSSSSKGERAARSWLVATSQNLAAGLAETRDLTDSLLGFFKLRLLHLQAMYDVNVGWVALGRSIGIKASRR